jgi:exosortase C (VPDSG-CTERM-specific)
MKSLRGTAGLAVYSAILVLVFQAPLRGLLALALRSDMNSHVLLIPWICAYLVFLKRGVPAREPSPAGPWAATFAVLCAAGLAAWLAAVRGGAPEQDRLAAAVFSFVSAWLAGATVLRGGRYVADRAFPLCLLYAMVPMPTGMANLLNGFLQRGSAEATHLLLWASGTTMNREGLVFHLPGLSMEVAEECSGIRSTLVLFITALMAGHLFLRSGWSRVALAASVVPLALLRNAVRITTIGLLTVYVDPNVINGPLHRRGGPLFFVLSLAFLLAILWALRRFETRKSVRRPSGNEWVSEP